MAACELQQRVDLLYDLTNARLGEARNNTGAAAVYGEISSPEELFTALDMNASDHFVDLGSGRGQIVLAAMMRTRGAPASAAGMELIVNRCQVAERAWHNASASVQEKVKFFCGDALQFTLPCVAPCVQGPCGRGVSMHFAPEWTSAEDQRAGAGRLLHPRAVRAQGRLRRQL